MRIKKWCKLSVMIAIVSVIVIAIFACVCSSARVDKELYAASEYMSSDNLALRAKVSADGRHTSKITDGKSSTAYQSKRISGDIILSFDTPITFNSIIIKEKGLNVKQFEISVSDNGDNYVRIFASDKIEYHRFCSVDPTSARYIKLSVLQSDSEYSISELEIYNESKRDSKDFRVASYIVNNWTGIANDTSKAYDERKQVIMEDMDKYPLDSWTHIFLYTGLCYDESGRVFIGSRDEAITEEETAKRQEGLRLVLECLRESCQNNVKISLVINNALDHDGMNNAMGDNSVNMIKNLIDCANRFGFNGIDIDYEFPASKHDFAVFDRFLIELRKAMDVSMNELTDSLLSCAFGTRDINYTKEAFESLDFVNVMTYDIMDQDGYHSSFWGGGAQAAVYFENLGVDRKKINMGIPFYGTQVDAVMEQYSYTNIALHDYYNNIYQMPGYTYSIPTSVYFNSPAMVRDKTAYALLSGYGGVMVWHGTADVEKDSPYSLWKAINTAVSLYGGKG